MIDIILCSYNSSNVIDECINSILKQTYERFNLFVFDDFSSDDTVSKIRKYKDPRITLISSKRNVGTYAAKNFVLKNYCRSKYVALHDSDDYSDTTRLEKQYNFAELHDAVCVGTAVNEFWDGHAPHTISDQKATCNERVNIYPDVLKREDLKGVLRSLTRDGIYEEYLKFKFCMNGTVLFKRDILEKLGGWDGRTRIAADTDIFIRILGIQEIHNIPEPLYNRRFHPKSLTASNKLGINSKERKEYNLNRRPVVEESIGGSPIVRDLYYPEIEYEVIKCAE